MWKVTVNYCYQKINPLSLYCIVGFRLNLRRQVTVQVCVYVCVCGVYLPANSACGFHTKPELGHSGGKKERMRIKQAERENKAFTDKSRV